MAEAQPSKVYLWGQDTTLQTFDLITARGLTPARASALIARARLAGLLADTTTAVIGYDAHGSTSAEATVQFTPPIGYDTAVGIGRLMAGALKLPELELYAPAVTGFTVEYDITQTVQL